MKKVISALTAAAMCASMSASVMTAFAAYSANDVTMYLKAIDAGKGTISEDGKTVTFATAADAANAVITIQSFIKADTQDPNITAAGVVLTTDGSTIKFKNGVDYAATTYPKADYTMADGTTFNTNMFVHNFGLLKKQGKNVKYSSNTKVVTWANSDDFKFDYKGNNMMVFKWAYDIQEGATKDSLQFMDTSASDAFPLTQMDVDLGAITDGTYTISYVDSWDNPNLAKPTQAGTFVTDFDNTQTIVPGTGLTIVVGDASATEPTVEEPTTEPVTDPQPTTDPVGPSTPSVDPVDPASFSKETLYFDNVVYDRNSEDGGVYYSLYVAKNEMTNGMSGFIQVNGKTPAEVFADIDGDQGDDGFAFNTVGSDYGKGAIAMAHQATTKEEGQKQLPDGSAVITYWIPIDASTPTGTYTFTFTGDDIDTSVPVYLSNFDKEKRAVDTVAGTLTITDGEVIPPTEPETTEPTQAPTQEPTQAPTQEPTQAPTQEPTQAPSDTPTPTDYLYGDVNKNGKVELVDIVMLNRFITGYGNQTLDDYQTVVANCYREKNETDAKTTKGDLNGKDSLEILKNLIGLVKTLPTNAK